MTIVKTQDFEKAFLKLPADIKKLYQIQEQRFSADWKDTRLHLKKLKDTGLAFSFRITRRYRMLFYFQTMAPRYFFKLTAGKIFTANCQRTFLNFSTQASVFIKTQMSELKLAKKPILIDFC